MQRKSFGEMACPIARGLERVGEWWSMLILRDAFAGISRFDEFQKSLGIAPTMLTRRLAALVESGLLERRRYSERPPRDEYCLTARGAISRPVLVAMLAWGNRHFAPEGETSDRRQPDRQACRADAGRSGDRTAAAGARVHARPRAGRDRRYPSPAGARQPAARSAAARGSPT